MFKILKISKLNPTIYKKNNAHDHNGYSRDERKASSVFEILPV